MPILLNPFLIPQEKNQELHLDMDVKLFYFFGFEENIFRNFGKTELYQKKNWDQDLVIIKSRTN